MNGNKKEKIRNSKKVFKSKMYRIYTLRKVNRGYIKYQLFQTKRKNIH